jgi:hypothetical protein
MGKVELRKRFYLRIVTIKPIAERNMKQLESDLIGFFARGIARRVLAEIQRRGA